MKFHIMSAEAGNQINGSVGRDIIMRLPKASMVDCDVVLVPISYFPDFKFNRNLLGVSKPWVMMDFLEYFNHHEDAGKTNLIGRDITATYNSTEWDLLHAWVKENPPCMYFKRELFDDDIPNVEPIEWPCYVDIPPTQTKDQFYARPFEVFNCWGYSHNDRKRLHGDIFSKSCDHHIHVASSFNHMDYLFAHREEMANSRPWATIFTPHFERIHITELLERQQMARVSVSMPGAGVKCFRSTEAPVGCVPAIRDDGAIWSIPWNYDNSIYLPIGDEFRYLESSLNPEALYNRYVNAQETIRQYQPEPYIKNQIIAKIEAVL